MLVTDERSIRRYSWSIVPPYSVAQHLKILAMISAVCNRHNNRNVAVIICRPTIVECSR